MICPHILDWPVGSGEPLLLDGFEWCMAHIALGWTCQREICCQSNCPFDFGEWGAWRCCTTDLTARYLDICDSPSIAESAWMDIVVMLTRCAAVKHLGAAGWSA